MAKSDEMLNKAVEDGVPVFKDEYRGLGYKDPASVQAVGPSIVGHVAVSTLVFGRHPGGKQPPSGYEQGTETPTSLMQWCMDKLGASTKEAKGLSFVVARKIQKYGNQVYQGKRPAVPVESTVEKVNESLFEQVNEEVKNIFKI